MRLLRDIDGVAAVEAAIVFPVLFFVGFGVLDAALLVQQTHRMEAGLGAAGSYLAQGEGSAEQRATARHVAVSGETAPGGQPTIAGWTAQDVRISTRGDASAPIAELSSSIPYKGLGLMNGLGRGRLRVEARYEVRLAS